ncbi:MAG: ABC transporter permease [Pseudomonadota bacterium]
MFKNYLLTAYKVFLRRKLFTAINLLCIVLTLTVLMVLTALLEHTFYPSGVEGKSDRFLQIVMMRSESPSGDSDRRSPLGYKLIEQYLKPMQSVEMVAAATSPRAVSVYQEGRISELQMRRVDANYWKILDFTLLAGRLPTVEDEERGRMVAVINKTTAGQLFGAEAAVGKTMHIGGQQLQVIGVVDDEMHLNAFSDVWAPVTTFPSTEYKHQMHGEFTALLLAKNPAGLAQIRSDVQQIAKGVEFSDPKEWSKAYFFADSKLDTAARLLMNGDGKTENSGAGLFLAIIVTLMLLFMTLPAMNLVNLNTGRILERSSEIGVRKAFGATSAQMAMQLIVENVLLCLAGGLLGLLLSQLALLWLENSGLIPYLKVSVNYAVMLYGLLLTLVFGLLSGVLPAWKMSRLDPVHALKGAI